VTKSEISQNPCKLKAYFLGAKMQYNFLKHMVIFKIKVLTRFRKNRILFLGFTLKINPAPFMPKAKLRTERLAIRVRLMAGAGIFFICPQRPDSGTHLT
jgi:hypothetical protein